MTVITRGHNLPRRVRLKLIDGSTVTGMINLIQRGETENRVSDIFVARSEPFVVIFQARLGSMTDEVLVINKQHIIWVIPEEENIEMVDRSDLKGGHRQDGLEAGNLIT